MYRHQSPLHQKVVEKRSELTIGTRENEKEKALKREHYWREKLENEAIQ